MSNRKILIADDDENICNLLELYLKKEKYDTEVCHNGQDAVTMIKQDKTFGLLILDLMMPILDGYEALTEIRKFSDVPVIMLSAKGESNDKILGLNYGADDYVTKPFEPQELISRIKAVFRRSQPIPQPETVDSTPDLSYSDLFVSLKNYIVKVDENAIDMAPKEIELLYWLAAHPGQVFTREQLLHKIWRADYQGDVRTVDVHVKRIREKLGASPNWELHTVWGVGYKFEVTEK